MYETNPWDVAVIVFILTNIFYYFTLTRPMMRLKDEHYNRLEVRYKKAKGYDV